MCEETTVVTQEKSRKGYHKKKQSFILQSFVKHDEYASDSGAILVLLLQL